MFSGYRLALSLSLSLSPPPSPDKVSRCSLGNLALNHHVDQAALKIRKTVVLGLKTWLLRLNLIFLFLL